MGLFLHYIITVPHVQWNLPTPLEIKTVDNQSKEYGNLTDLTDSFQLGSTLTDWFQLGLTGFAAIALLGKALTRIMKNSGKDQRLV